MNTLFEQDEALSNTLASALLIHTLESRQVYPLLGLKLLAMVDLQILAYFSAASWHVFWMRFRAAVWAGICPER